jgi:hypothetical protein
LQRAKGRPGVMRERQLAQQGAVLPFHISLPRAPCDESRPTCGRS